MRPGLSDEVHSAQLLDVHTTVRTVDEQQPEGPAEPGWQGGAIQLVENQPVPACLLDRDVRGKGAIRRCHVQETRGVARGRSLDQASEPHGTPLAAGHEQANVVDLMLLSKGREILAVESKLVSNAGS